MNVSQHGVRKIIVNDKIGVLEVNSSSDEISGNEGPKFSLVELLNDLLSFLFGFFSSQDFEFLLATHSRF